MPRFLVASALILLSFACPSIQAVDYAIVSYPEYQQGYVLTGKITTDGSIGDLAGHITAWEWYTSNGTITWEFDSTQSRSSLGMRGVRATADGKILLDRVEGEFTTVRNFLLLDGFSVPNSSSVGLLWRTGSIINGENDLNTDGFSILGSRTFPLPAWGTGRGSLSMPDTTGPIVIATLIPVPEPSTYVLTLLGLGCLAAFRKARRG